MNALSFFRFPWYSSGVFILVVVVLTLIFVVGVKGVSLLITTLFSFSIKLPVPYSGGDYNGPSVALNIKPNAYNLDNYDANTYSLPI